MTLCRLWIQAARPKTLAASTLSVLLASALSAYYGTFKLGLGLLCLGFALLCQILSNLANDYFDALKGADTPQRQGPIRLVASGLIPPSVMYTAVKIVTALALLVGCMALFCYQLPLGFMPLGLLCIAFAIAYTGGPFPLAYLGLGDLFVLIFFGLVSIGGTFYAQVGFLPLDVMGISFAYGLLASNILAITSYRDIETDKTVQKKTLGVRFGHGFVEKQYRLSLALALSIPFGLWLGGGYPRTILLSLGALPLALKFLKRWARLGKNIPWAQALKQTVLILVVYTGLFILGLSLGRVL